MLHAIYKHLRALRRDRRGHIALVTAIAAPVIVVGGGIGAETGLWYYKHHTAQISVDLAAYAGAVAARARAEPDAVIEAATDEAIRHGYDPARGPIAVNTPPLSGPNQNERSVEVIVTQAYPRLLSRILSTDDIRFTVRAVARYEQPGPACVLSLDPAGHMPLLFTGSSDVTLTNCDLMSNSIADEALGVTGSGNVITSCANSVGGMTVSASLVMTECNEPRMNLPPALDPLAHLEKPVIGGCTNIPGGGGAKTITPGRYCNGMNLNGDITMEPGVYIVDGGTFRTNGNSTVFGEGVTIFLTGDAEIRMNGNADINLSAPESGPYAGVLFWGDDANHPETEILFNGTAASALTGALYFPSQTIEMRGDFSGSAGCTRLIAFRIEISGAANFDSDCSAEGSLTVHTPGFVRLAE